MKTLTFVFTIILANYSFAKDYTKQTEKIAAPIVQAAGANGNIANVATQATYDSAKKSQSGNTLGKVVGYAKGAGLTAAGVHQLATACKPPVVIPGCFIGPALISAGLKSFQQSKNHAAAATTAGQTMIDSSAYGNGGGGDLGLNSGSSLANDPYIRSAVDVDAYRTQVESQIPRYGIDFNNPNATVKVGDKEFKVSDFASSEAMKNAGMPDSAIKGFESQLAAISALAEKKAEKAISKIGSATGANGYEEGGGAGKASSTTASSSDADAISGAAGGLGKSALGVGGKNQRDPSSVSGLSKDLNGDPIGVSADSIFAMMSRRYKLKEKQNSFIEINAAQNSQPSSQP